MKYRVHRLEISKNEMQEKLERFLNSLDGEVISVMPDITRYFLCYGAKIDFLLIVEKLR